ncbi:BnaC02g01540D [Brassica napus]|uniref:BnaC02g01540D protein n=1 Tax=Brassica napus TaxID=3708 RepID=A0A078FM84_BRANA|nr:BnaC02g01540D [Brassica napus]
MVTTKEPFDSQRAFSKTMGKNCSGGSASAAAAARRVVAMAMKEVVVMTVIVPRIEMIVLF